ncbi:restriction endonuclease subunit S [Elizabethkingia anophelis]|nr:restriction endonuclease subunit S [Elizabethkingia anophelis]
MKDKLPKDWEWKTLEYVCGRDSSNISQNQIQGDNGDFSIYGASGLIKNVSFYHQSKPYIGIVKDGAGVGRVMLLNAKTSVIGTLQYLIPEDNVDIKYLYYFLLGIDFSKYISGSTIPHIYYKNYKNEPFLLIPLSEQKQIVSVLDRTFEKLDQAIALIEENIQKLKQLNESVLDEVFNILLSRKNLVKLESLDNISAGGTPLRSKKEYWNGNINWFTSGELNEKYVYNSKEYITKKGFENSNTKLFPEGTLLVGMYDTAAFKMSILKEKATCNQAIVGIKPNEKFLPEFLYYQLTFLRPLVLNLRQGVRQQNLNSGKIKNINIYLPSILEQQRIVAYLDQTTEKNQKLTQHYQNKLEALKRFKNSVLDSAFKGELRRAKVIPITQPVIDPYFARTKSFNTKKKADKQAMVIALSIEAHEKVGKSLYRTKGEKTVEVLEKHLNIDFGREAGKMTAGPADFKHLVNVVEPLATEKKWFYTQEIKGENYDSHKYIKAENFNPFMMRCLQDLKSNLNEIRRVVNLFADMKTTRLAEVVATTYTGWNNLIIRNVQIDNETIVSEARENWHEAKLKIDRHEFFDAIEWLKNNNLVPQGNGKEVN